MLSNTSRMAGLAIAGGMFIFSAYMYVSTGDWVAAVFSAGSIGYGLFFFTTRGGNS